MKKTIKLLSLLLLLSTTIACLAACGDVAAESLVLSNTMLTLDVGEVKVVSYTVLPEDASNNTVEWSSSNPSVATVNNVGIITGIGAGSCTVTGSCGSASARISVTVKKPVEELILNENNITIREGDTSNLVCTISPNDASDKKVSWTSSDSSIATVNSDGSVTGLKVGKCTITASCGGKTISASVTVKKKGPDFKKLYDGLTSTNGWTLGSDYSYLSADTNIYNSDDYTNFSTLYAIKDMNTKMGLPDSLYNDMIQTTWSMGKQSETYENIGVTVTWTYHPDKGLEVTYKLIND